MNPEPAASLPDPRQCDLFAAPTQHGPAGEQPPAGPKPPQENYWDFCPNCSARLHNAGCKYRCPRCHYFMSCSDFD